LLLRQFRNQLVLIVAAHLRHECGLHADLPQQCVECDECVEWGRRVFLHKGVSELPADDLVHFEIVEVQD